MAKIIDIPYGTYLAYIDKMNISEEYIDLILEIAFGEWRGYFGAKDKVLSPKIPSGAYRKNIKYADNVKGVLENSIGDNKTVVAIIVGKMKNNKENIYRNVTEIVDWRTCDTLSPEARAWAEQHYDDNIFDDTPLAYDMLPYALEYAKAGFKIFPLCACDKVPLKDSNGFKDGTSDIAKVKKIWTDNPFYNIGAATGGGFAIIDVDEGEEEGKKKEGEKNIKAWQEENGYLPATLTVISGRGGRHLFYKDTISCNSETSVIKDVDIRADGGYIVLPPSVHENGNRYRFVGDFDIDRIAPADEVVNKFLALTKKGNASIKDNGAKTDTIKIVPQSDILERLNFKEGCRNDSLFRYGCSLQGKGVKDIDIFNELKNINLNKCTPPLSVEEVDRIYKSVISKPKGNGKFVDKLLPNKSDNTTDGNKGNNNDGEFFLARNITELGDMSYNDYLQALADVYPYVNAHYNDKTGEIYYSINPHKLAEYIRKNDSYFFIESLGEKPIPYWYTKGYYKQCSDLYMLGQIKKYIEVIDCELVEPSILSKIYKLLQTDLNNTVNASDLNNDSNIINFANGLLHLDTLTLHPHTPDIFSTIQIPCNWNPQALSSPVFNSFLHTLSGGDKSVKKLLWEYIGYVVSNIPGYKCKQALILYGAGNTGKSQYLTLLEKLIGPENYCSMSLQQLEMRFGTSALWGKRLAGNADMGSAKIDELEKFKAITGGDTIDFEYKGKDRFSGKYTGLLLFCCNNLPKFGGDRGEHVYDRMITLPCNNVVPFGLRDRDLIDKICTEKEAIIYHSVIALKKLIARGGYFLLPEVCQKAKEEYKTSNDNVRQFLLECTDHKALRITNSGINEYTKTSAMYEYYKRWCADSCYTAANRREFRRGIENYFGRKIDTIEFVYNGIKYYPFVLKSDIRQQYYPYG